MSKKKISWTVKELNSFKTMILDKKSKTLEDMTENKKRADEMLSSNAANAFSKYIKQFSGLESNKKSSVAEVTEKIRHHMRKVRPA